MVPIPVVTIMVAVIVPPGPIFLLLFRRQLAEIPVGIAMGLIRPAPVIYVLVMIPAVIVGVIGIVHPIIMMFAAS
jgi:hypothetical protein